MSEVNNEDENFAYSKDVEVEEKSSDSISVPNVQSQNSEEVSEKKDSETCDINHVVIDKSYLGRNSEIPELIKDYTDTYLSGREVPPIRVERNSNKLVDGYHRFKALLSIKELRDQGNLTAEDVSKLFHGDFINVEYVDIPEGIAPCLFSLNFNMSHGRKASIDDIKAAARRQFEKDKSYTAKKLAACIGVSEDTARRYCEEPIRERREKIREFIVKSDEQGKSQEQIESDLNKIFPGVPGTSQATISKILSEHRNVAKTDKIEPVKTKTDLDSSPAENTPTITNEENSEEPALESTPKDSDSVNSEASAGVNVPENPNFDECMKALGEAEESIIRKVEFLSSEEVKTILERIEEMALNIENQALELKLIE